MSKEFIYLAMFWSKEQCDNFSCITPDVWWCITLASNQSLAKRGLQDLRHCDFYSFETNY
jgi:hypothetical protein